MNIHFFAVRNKRTSKDIDTYQRYIESVRNRPHIWGVKDGIKNSQSINVAKSGDIVIVINFPEDVIEYATVKSFDSGAMEISRKAWGDAAYHNVFHLASSPIKTKLSIDEFRVIIDELFGYNKPTSLNHTSFTLVAEKHKAKFPEFLKRLNVKADNTRTSQGKVGKSAQTTEVAGKIEGAKYDIISTRYERNSKNRAACLKIHGYACKICGFEFVKKYGQYGKGYIQVHHVEPLSEIGNEVVVDPKVDLIPICCNCHAMIHHKTPALTPKELKRIYAKRMV